LSKTQAIFQIPSNQRLWLPEELTSESGSCDKALQTLNGVSVNSEVYFGLALKGVSSLKGLVAASRVFEGTSPWHFSPPNQVYTVLTD